VFTPTVAGTVTITATSTEDTTKSGSKLIVVGSSTTNGEWTWMSGSDTGSAIGVYGTLGVASTSNTPGARGGSVSWIDISGNLWLFGGGADYTGANGNLNDLWQFNPTNNLWTWMSGSSTVNSPGVYGTLGVASASNVPGARANAVSWTDSSGNLWLFGGCENDSSGDCVPFNDLWEFIVTTKEWAWVSGSSTAGASGTRGTLGVASTSNVPASRYQAVSWTDSDGNFWLFGGIGLEGVGIEINDLWEFNPTARTWTWWGGAFTYETEGIYGTKGVAAASNFPGSRDSAIGWTDSGGNLWLFGGIGADSNDMWGDLNDLWEFSPTTKEWTWMGGSDTEGAVGVYGTGGVTSASNVPGARYLSVSWTDKSGNLWLFGGDGLDSAGTYGNLNDLWEFNPMNKEWTWMSGSDTANASGVYGTLGTPAAANVPIGRIGAISWTDGTDNLWLFGGAYNGGADLNDLWRYQP
jgi:N-acetylneuraminic acid mutarotase